MTVEAICITYSVKLCFSQEAIKNMQRLRILRIPYHRWLSQSDSDDSIEYLSNNLCWFVWYGYPWKSLPQNFNPTRLVHIELQRSSLHYLWNETKQLSSLRMLDLSYSESLKRTPDFTRMPNLEYLDLSGCKSLEEVHHSLKCSRKLIGLNLYACKSLKKFPYVNVESLEYVNLNYCSSLEKFPEIVGIMKPELEIKMSFSRLREIPSSIILLQWAHLTELDLSGMNNLVSLPSSICKLKDLVKLHVSRCSKLESLPEGIGDLENLEELDASWTLISHPPSSIIHLNKLKLLTFAKGKTEDRVYFLFPQVNEGLRSLEELNLNHCNLIDGGLPKDIGSLSSLKELNLKGNNFEHLPRSIAQLGALRSLNLFDCNKLKELPAFTGMNLDTLDLGYCNLIDGGLPKAIGCLSSLKVLNLSGNNFEYLPRSISQLGALRTLNLLNCDRLKEFPGFMGMSNLDTLDLSYCNLIDGGLPDDIGCLSSLKVLNLSGNIFEHLPQTISQLGALRTLNLLNCDRLKELPEIPQQLNTISANWSSDWICNSLFQNISSLQHDISVSDSLSLRVFTSWGRHIPSWFHHRAKDMSVLVNLHENWYASDNFLGFSVCYSGKLIHDIIAHLIPLCDDGTSWMTQKFSLSNHSKDGLYFLFIPLAGLWDASKANGKMPNDYGCFGLNSPGQINDFGVRLLYKDEAELQIGIRRSRYEEGSCSSSKKQRSQFPWRQ